jgi:hypothetical protein
VFAVQLISAVALVAAVAALIVVAYRGLGAQRGSHLKRTPEEDRHVGRANIAASSIPGP